MEVYASCFRQRDLSVAQVLLTRDVLGNRAQYLNAKAALDRMLSLGVVPIVNENDTVAVEELKVGDNDQLAAITAHLVGASMLVILTDTAGLYTEDPRISQDAKLLSAVRRGDEVLDRIRVARSGGAFGSGGVATKVAAARMAAFSGIPTVIASATERDVVAEAAAGRNVGTWIDPRQASLSARKLWIAFGLPSRGSITVDDGAMAAIAQSGGSLLAVGLTAIKGDFRRGDAVEVFAASGLLIGKGIARFDAADLHSSGDGVSGEVIHRDDLVVLA